MKQQIVEDFNIRESKVTVVPYGINDIVFQSQLTGIQARKRLGLKEDEKVPDSQIVYGMGMNIGGTAFFDDISITMTQAFHSSQTASPAGYIIRLEDGFTLYHTGDTGIFSSMKLFGELFHINLAMVPIGGVFTMDPQQAASAVKLLGASTVIPMHFKTFPILEQDASSFKEIMEKEAPDIEVVILEPGQDYVF